MKNRIKKVMDESGLSASKFADKIGVPRSGLSHVLSGRNKPSLDYVLKVLNAFPKVDPNWLLLGREFVIENENKMENNDEVTNSNSTTKINDSLAMLNTKMEGQVDKMLGSITKVPSENSKSTVEVKSSPKSNSKVSRIVFFYNDGSFEEYLTR
jgi:transcriptional regulator with XRE-family HTH domain